MNFHESKTVELKETLTKTLLKTVSAFLNDAGGTLYIGVNDLGKAVGLEHPTKDRLKLENMINDSISPKPDFKIQSLSIDGKTVLELKISPGEDAPYYYRQKAYTRNDTSSVPLDGPQLTRMILKRKNLTYDQLSDTHPTLSFDYFSQMIQKYMSIDHVDDSVLTTLGLKNQKGYTHAAALLADSNTLAQSTLDLAKFKLNQDVFENRLKLTNQSILSYFDTALTWFEQYYHVQEVVEGMHRTKHEKVPYIAFKEALANAIVHRDYLISSGIQIGMYDNRIEIISPGGLPEGIDEAMYLKGVTSVPRNPVITMVFFRLGLIEHFGTGIKRIIQSYQSVSESPSFMIYPTSVKVILPVVGFDYTRLKSNEAIIEYLKAFPKASRAQIEKALHENKSSVVRKLNRLLEQDKIILTGQGPSTLYQSK